MSLCPYIYAALRSDQTPSVTLTLEVGTQVLHVTRRLDMLKTLQVILKYVHT